MTDLKGKRVAIIVTDGFEQIEMTSPREALDKAGAKTVLISPKDGQVQGFTHHDRADKFNVDLPLARANASDFDAVVIPGGYSPDHMRRHPAMVDLVTKAAQMGKVLAAICHGPWVLCSTTALRGKRATCFHAIKDDVINAGGKYEDAEVVRDGNLITSRKPDDLPAFVKTITEALDR